MRMPGLSHTVLMEQSESRIENLAREGSTPHARLAQRILDDTHLYRLWEAEHDRIMRGVSSETRRQRQAMALRSACFGLIHRKAMFDYLRVHRITGRDRHAVFELIYGDQDYVKAVVAEHSNHVRSTSSLLCSNFLGLTLLQDRAFGDPMLRYEQRYADYFRTFCGSALTANRYNSDDTLSTLLPYLKRQLGELRREILALPPERNTGGPEVPDIQSPAANSQRMPAPFRAA